MASTLGGVSDLHIEKQEQPRWLASIAYKRDFGNVIVERGVEELSELEEIVEKGPDWNCIQSISVKLNEARRSHNLTVEQAEAI